MSPDASPRSRAIRAGLALRAARSTLAWSLSLIFAIGSIQARPDPAYVGRPLADVLQEMKDRGLRLIFSSAVVTREMKVTVEPASTEPRAILDEILKPLGLEAREGPAGSILILESPVLSGSLEGTVRSVETRAGVAGATVRISGRPAPASTAPDGSFGFAELPPGLHTLIVDALGFKTSTLARVSVSPGKRADVEIWLHAQPGFVTAVVVTPSRLSVVDQEVAAKRITTNEDAVLAPSFGDDVNRVIELLPGVTGADNSSSFHVRGSRSGDTSIVLDGLELYDPFHLQGFSSPFSLIDSNIVDRADFSGGGFTAEFGDRLGGLLDIRTLTPSPPHRGALEMGTLNSRLSYLAPSRGGGASWLVSARAWYPEAFRDSIELGGGERLDPRFSDLYVKAGFASSARSVLSVHALAAQDHMDFAEPAAPGGPPGEQADALTRNGYLWLTLLNAWSQRSSSETIASIGMIDRERSGLSRPDDDTFRVDDSREVGFSGLRHDSTWRFGEAQALKAGFDVRRLNASYRYSSGLMGDPSTNRVFKLAPDGTSLGAYAAYRVRIAPSVTTEIGVRWDRQDYTDDEQVSPRFNAVWRPGERTEVKLAAGRYFQSQRIHELRIEDGETRFHRAELSNQAEVSILHQFSEGLRFRLDAYHKRLTNPAPYYENLFKPVELFPETGSDRVRIAPSLSRLQGIEMMLLGRTEAPLTWWVSYALASAIDEVGAEKIPRSWDQTHTGKFLVGYRWDKRWMCSLTGTAHTGWPTTPERGTITILPGGQRRIDEILGERNSDRFPPYFRLDAKASRSFAMRRGRIAVTAELLNLTNRKNPCCVDEFLLKARPNGTVDVNRRFDYWRRLTPSFSVLWEF